MRSAHSAVRLANFTNDPHCRRRRNASVRSGVWVFGSTDDEDRNMGMGVVVEYENRHGEPQWIKPAKNDWAYPTFAMTAPAKAADETIKHTACIGLS